MKRLKTTMQAMVALSPGCLEAVRLQLESSDHLLPPPARRLWLHNHLMPCKGCRRYGSQIQFFGNASQQETRPALPPNPHGLSLKGWNRIRPKNWRKHASSPRRGH